MHLKKTVQLIALTFAAPVVYANGQAGQSVEVKTVTVTADRHAQALDKAAPNVAVVSRKELDSAAAANLDDVVLYEPGVDVPTDNSRRGNAGVNIRGIGGNRILMMVDGIRVPEAYAGGGSNAAVSGRDLVEADTLKQVDIVKGPYSALYGSDALGGVVNFSTYSPADFVDAEKPFHFGLKHGYRSRDRSHGVTATAAGYTENAQGLLMLTHRQGHESKNRGGVDTRNGRRTKPNPQDFRSYNILAKGDAGNETHRVEALFEHFYRKKETDLLNTLGTGAPRGPRVTTTTSSSSDDRARRQRIELGYRYRGDSALKEANIYVYRQRLKSEDDAVTDETARMAGRITEDGIRYSDYGFNQTTQGINTRGVFEADTGRLKHTIVAGAEFKKTDTERPRESTTIGRDGRISHMYAGALYPNKTFPDSRRRTVSVYAQDSLAFPNGIVLTPALRFEHEKLKPKIDQAYLNSKPDSLPKDFSDSSFTPSLRLSVPFGEAFTGFATYSRGFRTPPFDTATMSFNNSQHGYKVIPNNNLKSEHSDSVELGLKYKDERTKAQVTTFYNRYRDFINRTQVRVEQGAGGRPIRVHRYDNLDKVKTYGIEAAAAVELDDNWQFGTSIAWMRGKDGEGKPLDTAYPLNGVLSVDYAQEKWGAGTKLRWATAQKRTSNPAFFKAPGYGVWDAGVWYKPLKNLSLGLNVYNLANKKYWQHADVAGAEDLGTMDAYTQPGRNVAASLQLKF